MYAYINTSMLLHLKIKINAQINQFTFKKYLYTVVCPTVVQLVIYAALNK